MNVGRKIRQIRMRKGLTLQGLADLTGLTKGYLSKIERSKDAPRIVTLQAITGALQVEIDEFFRDSDAHAGPSHNIDIVKSIHGRPDDMLATRAGYSYRSLVHSFKGRYMTPLILRVQKGHTSSFTHDSEEFAYVLEGSITCCYEGKEYPLEAGDSIYLDSRIEHSYVNKARSDAVLLAVVHDYRRF